LLLALLLLASPAYAQEAAEGNASAAAPTGPESIDQWMQDFLAQHEAPGASLAIVKDGELLYARGFGYADIERKQPVTVQSRFRIASISKPITAIAVLRLVEAGKLHLDDRLLDVLPLDKWFGGPASDRRWEEITIRQLLQHRAGWQRKGGFDPMVVPAQMRKVLGVQAHPSTRQIMAFMWQQPLDFDPGSAYAYSNFGYCILGRVIEHLTEESYEAACQKLVLQELELSSLALGRSTIEAAHANEVQYVGRHAYRHNHEVMDAHGGWIATASDLARFADAFAEIKPDNDAGVRKQAKLLKPASIAQMWARPPASAVESAQSKSPVWYGLGWSIRQVAPGKLNAWHAGLLSNGSSALMVRRHDGYCWAVLFNYDRSSMDGKPLSSHFDSAFHGVVNRVKSWRRAE